jgi:ribonuclease BN (tRNA processing enzyme)
MKIKFLGTAGWYPSEAGIFHPSVLLPEYNAIFDAGNGLADRNALSSLEGDVDLFLSHIHGDHTSGMPSLRVHLPKDKINILKIHTSKEYMRDVLATLGRIYPAYPYQIPCKSFSIVAIKPEVPILVKDGSVIPRTFYGHTEDKTPVVGFKLLTQGKSLTYLVDVAPTREGPKPEVIDFVRPFLTEKNGLICDCYAIPGHKLVDPNGNQTPYSSPFTVSELVKQAGITDVFLIHPSPELKRDDLERMLKKTQELCGESVRVKMPKDKEEIEF